MTDRHQIVSRLRQEMLLEGIDALIVSGSDPHGSEYPAECWRFRKWLTGFTGSAGRVVITWTEAALETDSRYFLQAEQQLKDSPFGLIRAGEAGGENLYTWLAKRLPAGSTVATDPEYFSTRDAETLISFCDAHDYRARFDFTPLPALWENRPGLPLEPIVPYPVEYSGETVDSKAQRVLDAIAEEGANALFMTALDDVAWLFNLRGSDVPYNPVGVAYAYLSRTERVLFADAAKISAETDTYLKEQQIALRPYEDIWDFADGKAMIDSLLLDPARTNYRLYQLLIHAPAVHVGASPVPVFKSIRNAREVAGMDACMVKDGVAMVRFLKWLEEAVPQGGVTECTISVKLRELRAQQPLFKGESFGTIAGYEAHGAIVHYEATPETDVELHPKGLLLVDSGAQYLDGTTDLTRTLALGEPTEAEKRHFTLVLKGHIALATCRFPAGTRGAQLDVLARQFLWNDHLLYLHGTGHGVGHYLNVHEGPQNIRLEENLAPLRINTVTSNEPGVYLEGRHGIRIENLVRTVMDEKSEFGDFYRFETLTLCPIDRKAIEVSMLTEQERTWLNDYHERVYQQLSPCLTAEESAWLRAATQPI